MAPGSARLVLNKRALCGLNVRIWDDQLRREVEGNIVLYEDSQDSFVIVDRATNRRFAVQFDRFTVLEEQQQLVLSVSKSTQVSVPDRRGSSNGTLAVDEENLLQSNMKYSLWQQPSAQDVCKVPSTSLAAEVSQQLTELVGQCFSHTADGFCQALADSPAAIQPTAADEGSLDEEVDSMLYWGSPIRCESAMVAAAAPFDDAAAAAVGAAAVNKPAILVSEAEHPQQRSPEMTESKAELCEQRAAVTTDSPFQGHTVNSSDGSFSHLRSSLGSQSDDAGCTAAAAATAPMPACASYSSFREISRMISSTEPVTGTPIPIQKHNNSGKHHLVAGHAARLLEETASWGTPRDGSAWGTPREQQLMEVACSHAAAGSTLDGDSPIASQTTAGQQQQHVTAGYEGTPSATAPAAEVQNIKLGHFRSIPSMSQASADPGAVELSEDVSSLETDFTIAVGLYEQDRSSAGIGTRRSRELYRIPSSEATDAGMMVDIPQPLSSRRISRTSVRNLLMGSDPGAAAAAGGLPAAGELRRAASGLNSRRISRTTSSRLTADQGVSVQTAESAVPLLQQQTASLGFSLNSAGVPVHVPGSNSRRTSRTLSGRLPLDQDGAVVVAQLPDDSAPDVLTRPVTATSVALDTIVSRRQSSNDGRPGTPDSDGFGYSEFEGIEPLVPPELAQWDAIAEQAALHNADAVIPAHHSHRHQRRSVRNMGTTAAPSAAAQRPSMRISDQDDHGVISPPGSGAVSNRSYASAQVQEETEQSAGHNQQSVGTEAVISPLHTGRGSASQHSRLAVQGSAAKALEITAAQQVESTVGVNEAAKAPSRLTGLSKIHQVAAAAAGAAAAAVGFGLSGTAGMVQDKQDALVVAEVRVVEDAIAADPGCDDGDIQALAALSGSLAADSFSCPPYMPLVNSAAVKSNPFADPDLFNSTIGEPDSIAAAYQTGLAVPAAEPIEQAGSSGSPTAMLSRYMLPGDDSECSEWGSGRFAAHFTSGIDTPTGSGIFRTNPFAEGSECGSATSSHLDGLQSTHGLGKSNVGTSRMAREAAAAAMALTPFSGLSADSGCKSSGASISEITPASDDEGEDQVYTSNGNGNTALWQQGPLTAADGSSNPGRLQCRTHATAPAETQQEASASPSIAAAAAAISSEIVGTRTPAQLGTEAQGPVLTDSLHQQPACEVSPATTTDTRLVRRAASRSLSQNLPREAVVSSDGIMMLAEPNYNYGDDDHQPLVQQCDGMTSSTPGKVPRTIAGNRGQAWRVLLHILLTNSAQWYDSIALVVLGDQLLAAMANPELSKQQQTGLLFSIFAAGHAPWLVGCFLWPWVAGQIGPKTALVWTVCLSAFATALIGCMPAHSVGAGAGIAIITVLRLLSGLSTSNNAPAALSYLSDHAPQLPHLHTSLVMGSMACGALGAGAMALFLALVLSETQLNVVGWRLPLVASLVVNGISGWLRGFVLQDPEQHSTVAELQDRRNSHVWRVVGLHASQVLAAVVHQLFALTGLYLLTAWMPMYCMQYTGLAARSALTVYTVNTALLVGCIPLGGFLADQYGRTSILLATCAAAAAFAYPAWLLFSLSVASVSWFAHFTLVAFVGLHCGALGGALMELFPRGVRCSALTLSCIIPMVLFGSMVPLMALSLVQQTGSLSSPAILFIITAVITSAGVIHREFRH